MLFALVYWCVRESERACELAARHTLTIPYVPFSNVALYACIPFSNQHCLYVWFSFVAIDVFEPIRPDCWQVTLPLVFMTFTIGINSIRQQSLIQTILTIAWSLVVPCFFVVFLSILFSFVFGVRKCYRFGGEIDPFTSHFQVDFRFWLYEMLFGLAYTENRERCCCCCKAINWIWWKIESHVIY